MFVKFKLKNKRKGKKLDSVKHLLLAEMKRIKYKVNESSDRGNKLKKEELKMLFDLGVEW